MTKRWRYVRAGLAAVFLAGATIGVLARSVFSTFASAADQPAAVQPAAVPTAAAAAPATSADEKAIRATADQFVKAFNAGDAKTIGGSGPRTRSTPTKTVSSSTAGRTSKKSMPHCSKSIRARRSP